jgi:hypothetical protein
MIRRWPRLFPAPTRRRSFWSRSANLRAVTVFREAGPDDFEHILRLYRQLHPGDPVLHDGSDAAAFAQIAGSPGLHLFVLEAGGVVVATTYLNIIPNLTRSASPYAIIENVVVEETLRGTGRGLLQSDAADGLAASCHTRVLQSVRFLARRQDGVPRSPIVMPCAEAPT